jgi:hypothetical protein
MKKRELAELVCVIVGIYLLIQATYMTLVLSNAVKTVVMLYHGDFKEGSWWPSLATDPIPFVVFLAAGLIFVLKRKTIAEWLTRGWGESSTTVDPVSEATAAAFAIIGVLVAARALENLNVALYLTVFMLFPAEHVKSNYWGQIVVHSVTVVFQIILAYALFFRGKGLATWWARRGKKGEAGDVGGGEKP